ncbi:TPA: efflux RND transporter permease subunit [Legionella pneumophila]|uniref:Chemiosmotic efflux system protein A-like protein n=1 Tax=Legionella pneumophila subsp. pneumophila TaxID=91891 RepID=A0AAV2UYB1_LEGPN|nr:efflux RND transporter permease subunit [Legionella pneumophila]MCK1848843.1 efflux RND transporter permease subunit [Legionella pneumophila]MDI9851994.1 efflux RND transporter permease subunit [Legionella pneumophila]MDW8853380.1 efflux RND transporter permease subunit [Legionella pneumophila]MDW8866236.1 efflux RND transporter permease subunit [Legionella pneumophila]MDW8922859.1 efflux RND transporter permease subunit [Legionella pneumophila]
MFTRLIAWSLHNRLLVLALTIILCLLGGYTLRQMPVDVFPEFAPPQVVVQTQAPGMATQDVETLITYPLESAINGTPGVASVRSKTSVGLSTITVVFDDKTDIYLNRQLVNERIQQVVNRLPPGISPPVMLPVTSAVGWLLKYALVSHTASPETLRTISDWTIRPRLLALGGVASVVSLGGEVKQYQVQLDPKRMLAYGITVEEVRQALATGNQNVPGAFVHQGGTEFVVSTIGRIKTLDDIKKTLIVVRKGVPVTVNNVATVAFGGEIKRGDASFNAEHAVIGTVSKIYGADTLTTTLKVEQALADIKKSLPAGIELNTEVFRQANFIESAIHNLTKALIEGAVIVIAVLFLFLMNWRASFITFLSMPVSFIVGILVLHYFGFGINSMTLGGMAIAIGEVVDDGIITVENVVHRLRLNRLAENPLPAIEIVFDAVLEIRSSVVYATIIISLVFLPIFFLSGIPERIFSPLAIAYIASVLGSLVVSITMVPALCYLLLARKTEKNQDAKVAVHALSEDERYHCTQEETVKQAQTETRFVIWLKKHFLTGLNWSLAHCKTVVAISIAAFVFALSLLPFFGTSFLPEFHEGNFIIVMSTLPGTSLNESMRLGKQVSKTLLKYPQVISIAQRAGRSELDEDALPPNISEFDVHLNFGKDKTMSPDELLQSIRADLANIPGALFNVGQFIAHRMDEVLSGVRAQVAVKLFGDNLATLNELGESVESILKTVPGVVDINKEQQINVPQLVIKIDREKAARYGVNIGQISEDIQILLNGVTVSSILEGQRTFDLYLRMDETERDSVKAIQNMLIDAHGAANNQETKIPLRAVAEIQLEPQPFAINRENVQRVLVIGFNVQEKDLGSVIQEVQHQIKEKISLPGGYFVQYGGQFESQQQASRVIVLFGALAVFIMLVLLHKAFGTFREALLVMFNLPLALIGGVVSLFIASGDMSVAAMIGFITLFGIAARNGIILVSHYNQLRSLGREREQVVIQGTLDRLVPVLMTAATAALALIPLLWGSPAGKELQRPLAQVLLGGLLTSTVLNMLVVPTVYNVFEIWHEKRRQLKKIS